MRKLTNIFKGDMGIWMIFFVLSVISLVAVYSTIGLQAYSLPGTTPTGLFVKHVAIVIATYIAIIMLSMVNYRAFSRISQVGYVVSLVLLIVVMAITGGGRWIDIPHFGQFQPSEIAKVFLIVFVARTLTSNADKIKELGTFITLLLIIGAVTALVLPENLSTAILIFITCYMMMLIGGVNKKYWIRTFLALVIIGGLLFFVAYQRGSSKEGVLERSSTWVHRVDSWLHPNPDELSQENMARMAIARGGVIGVGVGNTVHARLMTQAHNDFIYAIIIEETGMVGGIVVFALYSMFFFCCVRLAWRCRGTFGSLTVAGLGMVIYFQALINMSVAVGLLPVTGQTLPFISYGGTAYLFLGCGVGIIQSVACDVIRQERAEKAAAAEIVEPQKTETV
ncbi:MAG: FtsW/RodA/SpoVE family cell cycle protein [Bacteroidales bacterium]|nr:FtsW/RodA/SpoVE family cell cycle protein [Bacteroidales bacterium]